MKTFFFPLLLSAAGWLWPLQSFQEGLSASDVLRKSTLCCPRDCERAALSRARGGKMHACLHNSVSTIPALPFCASDVVYHFSMCVCVCVFPSARWTAGPWEFCSMRWCTAVCRLTGPATPRSQSKSPKAVTAGPTHPQVKAASHRRRVPISRIVWSDWFRLTSRFGRWCWCSLQMPAPWSTGCWRCEWRNGLR